MTALATASGAGVGNPLLNIGIFAAFVLVTLGIVIKVASGQKTAGQMYTGGAAFSGKQNGVAIAGDYLSAASFLGIAGAIALQGYDGFLYSIGFLVAWLVALLLVAELMRNTGRFTMADVLSYRLKQRPVRMAAATSALSVSFFYLLAQMAGAGALVSLLLGVTGATAQNVVIAVVGAVMVAYVMIGGMKGTTWVQIIKAVLLIAATAIMTIWVLALFKFNLSGVFTEAVTMTKGSADPKTAAAADKLLTPGLKYGKTEETKLDFISLALALVLGTAGLPHVIIRFFTVPKVSDARKSAGWALVFIALLYTVAPAVGSMARFNLTATMWPGAAQGETFSQPAVSLADIETSEDLAWMRNWQTTGLLNWEDKNGDGLIQYYNDGAAAQATALAAARTSGDQAAIDAAAAVGVAVRKPSAIAKSESGAAKARASIERRSFIINSSIKGRAAHLPTVHHRLGQANSAGSCRRMPALRHFRVAGRGM